MKIIRIGRSSSNDICINDSLVSREHCQIIQDDYGNFSLIDTNSKNGTFVNGTKRHGKVHLNTSDIVRIGNTTLPWQTYFHQIEGPFMTPTNGRTVTIGRKKGNNIVINDPYVSSSHCTITQESNGSCWLIDTNSKNGTYVNGDRIQGPVRLNQNDVVRIGNTTLPWQTYLHSFPDDSLIDPPTTYPSSDSVINPPTTNTPSTDQSQNQQSNLGTIALVLSIVGTGLLIYCAIQIMKWGIFAWIGNSSTFAIVSVGMNVIAYILASIADNNDYKDSDAASIAKWLSGSCILIVIGFFLYLKFGDPHVLNPLKDILN